jgi:6-pyruvoyltetrahydropterin/6-carboxytetrahydropterin synthase
MTGGFEVGTSVSVRALHRMPVEGPEGELHPHDYRIDVVVERPALDEHGMVVDLDVLNEALQGIAGSVAGRDLEAIRPPEAEAVTVEIFARWVHGKLAAALAADPDADLTVRVWESDKAFGGFRAPITS